MSAALIIAGKLAASGKTTKIIIILLGIFTGKSTTATNSSQNYSNYIVYFS